MLKMILKFAPVRKCWRVSESAENRPTTRISPIKGPARLAHADKTRKGDGRAVGGARSSTGDDVELGMRHYRSGTAAGKPNLTPSLVSGGKHILPSLSYKLFFKKYSFINNLIFLIKIWKRG